MADTFHLELVSPGRRLVSENLVEAIIPGQDGDFAALANHSRLVAQIRPGILTVKLVSGEQKQFFLRGGFADVGPVETAVIAEYAVPLEDFTATMLADEIALAEAALEEARGDASLYAESDRLERLQSLQPRIAK